MYLTNKMLVVVVCCWCTMHSIASFAEMRFMFCFIDIYYIDFNSIQSFDLYSRPANNQKYCRQSYDQESKVEQNERRAVFQVLNFDMSFWPTF